MTKPTDDMLRLAREIVAGCCSSPTAKADVLAGKFDTSGNMDVALAAISQTTDRAEKLADALTEKQMPALAVYVYLRRGDHLKQQEAGHG